MTVEREETRSTGRVACAWCGSDVDSGAGYCPWCGHEMGHHVVPDTPPASWSEGLATERSVAGPAPGPFQRSAQDDTSVPGDDLVRPRHLWRANRRGTTLGGIALVVLLLVAIGGTARYRDARTEAAAEAFGEAQRAFTSLSTALARAEDPQDAAAAARMAASATPGLRAARDIVGGVRDASSRTAVEVLEAELEVAAAVSELAHLGQGDLTAWLEVREALADSLAYLADAREALDRLDRDTAMQVPLASGVTENLDRLFGSAVTADWRP